MSSTTDQGVQTLTSGLTLPRVNLLPPEVHQARKLRRTKAALGAGVAAVAVLLGGVYFLQVQSTDTARTNLAGVSAQGVALQAKKAQYSAVPTTINAYEAAENARQSAMASDVQWYRYLNDLSYIVPKNAWLTSLAITTNGATTSTTPAAGSSAADSVASISINGSALSHDDVASWLEAADLEHGWNNAYLGNSTKAVTGGSSTVSFGSTINVTSAALSHRYDGKAG